MGRLTIRAMPRGDVRETLEQLLQRDGAVSTKRVAQEAGVSRQAAQKQLKALVASGVLRVEGKARAAKYSLIGSVMASVESPTATHRQSTPRAPRRAIHALLSTDTLSAQASFAAVASHRPLTERSVDVSATWAAEPPLIEDAFAVAARVVDDFHLEAPGDVTRAALARASRSRRVSSGRRAEDVVAVVDQPIVNRQRRVGDSTIDEPLTFDSFYRANIIQSGSKAEVEESRAREQPAPGIPPAAAYTRANAVIDSTHSLTNTLAYAFLDDPESTTALVDDSTFSDVFSPLVDDAWREPAEQLQLVGVAPVDDSTRSPHAAFFSGDDMARVLTAPLSAPAPVLEVASAGALYRLSARLLLADHDDRPELTLDFTGVMAVSDEFLEEIFGDWATAHPATRLHCTNVPAFAAHRLKLFGHRAG